MGPLGPHEMKMLGIFAVLSVMWFSNLSESIPAELLMATVLFLPGVCHSSSGPMPRGCAVGHGDPLRVEPGAGHGAAAEQVVQWAAYGAVTDRHAAARGRRGADLRAGQLVRLGMTNMTGVVATLFPLSVAMAPSMGLNPVWLGMVCVIGSSMGFFYPSQNASCLLTYAFGYYSSARHGQGRGGIFVIISPWCWRCWRMFYWPLVGLPIARST